MNMTTSETEMQTRVWQAALAGLLHDVGKVEQRARVDPWNFAPDLKDSGQPVHATWSIYFAQNYVPQQFRAAALAGAYHHAPDQSPASERYLSELVELADKLSAGERAELAKESPDSKPPNQLVSIFDRLSLGTNKVRAENYLPLEPLGLDSTALFPQAAQARDARGNAYETLRTEVENAARENITDPQTYLEHMLAATQRLTWCVPSAYYHSIPDVSLHDHSRMTAALAACLANWDKETMRALLGAVRRDFRNQAQSGDDALLNQDTALLIGGDISGVQDFIYTLTSQDAAKTLRGRSFYLQLLGEAVLRFVLRELNLPYTNVIYSGGGNFFLLAPVSAQQELLRIRRAVAEKLLTHHGSTMYLAIGATRVPARGFKRGQFKTHWDRMHREIGIAKQRRYQELDGDLYARVFARQAHGGNWEKTCDVCGDETEVIIKRDDAKFCPFCDSTVKLGTDLTHADFVALGFSKPQKTEKYDAASALGAFGMQVEFAETRTKVIEFKIKPERAVIWALDDLKKGEEYPSVRDAPTARITRYTVNRIPQETFDELQKKSDGIARLGVLRMDVDNLGDLFSKGFGEDEKNIATLARISTLSFQLGLFFDGWVKKICAEPKYENLVYAVYAGGDDVFLIAPWSIVPDLARRIVQDLAAYTAHNPDLHLSAGMTFIHGKYPVYQAAEDAHDALDEAKALDGKNGFSFLGQAWKWSEFENVHTKFGRLEKLVRAKNNQDENGGEGFGAQQAILQTFRQFAQMEAEAAKGKKKPVWGKWMWLGAYKLTRDADRAKEPLKGELLKLRDELGSTNYQEIAQWGAAARWVQLFVREKSTKEAE